MSTRDYLTPQKTTAPSQNDNEEATSIDLMPYIYQVLERRRSVIAVAMIGLALGVGVAAVIPPRFTAVSSFLPPGGGSSSLLAGQLGALSGAGLLVGAKTPGDLYAGILGSESVKRELVERFNLRRVYGKTKESVAETILAKHTAIDVGIKDSIVTISVTDGSAERARDLANGYLDALQHVDSRLAMTEAAQRRLFFQKELEAEKSKLADAEVALKQTQEQTGYILPTSQAALQVSSVAETQTEIAGREIRLAALLQSSTDANPEVIRLRSEINGLRSQLIALQRGTSQSSGLSTEQVPKVALESVRRERDVRYQETLFDILSRQFEAAHLDEAKEGPSLQILDNATLPDVRSGPSRLLISLIGLVIGLFIGVVGAVATANAGRFRGWLKHTSEV